MLGRDIRAARRRSFDRRSSSASLHDGGELSGVSADVGQCLQEQLPCRAPVQLVDNDDSDLHQPVGGTRPRGGHERFHGARAEVEGDAERELPGWEESAERWGDVSGKPRDLVRLGSGKRRNGLDGVAPQPPEPARARDAARDHFGHLRSRNLGKRRRFELPTICRSHGAACGADDRQLPVTMADASIRLVCVRLEMTRSHIHAYQPDDAEPGPR